VAAISSQQATDKMWMCIYADVWMFKQVKCGCWSE